MIEPASGGICRRDLSHRKRNYNCEQTPHRPADPDRCATCRAESCCKSGDAARKDTNDRKRNCKIRKPAHSACKLLRVTEIVQLLYIFVMVLFFPKHNLLPNLPQRLG